MASVCPKNASAILYNWSFDHLNDRRVIGFSAVT